jgi:hypothetical protein
MSLPNPSRQRAAREKLADLFRHPQSVHAIHYACQSFYSAPGAAPSLRVVCIAVRQLDSGQVTTFSVSKIAELRRIQPQHLAQYADYLERTMFGDFNEFLRTNKSSRFLHWNMRDDRYGFNALAHRHQVLGGTPDEVPEHNRIDVAQLVADIYGDDYVKGRAKLQALGTLNGLAMAGFLVGHDEAAAIESGLHREVHASTLTKVRLIAEITTRTHDRTLVTEAGLMTRYGGPARIVAQKMLESPGYAFATGTVGAFVVMFKAYDWMFGG